VYRQVYLTVAGGASPPEAVLRYGAVDGLPVVNKWGGFEMFIVEFFSIAFFCGTFSFFAGF